MKEDFHWVRKVLTHKGNEIKHYESLKHLIELFRRKWNNRGGEFIMYVTFLEMTLKKAYRYDD